MSHNLHSYIAVQRVLIVNTSKIATFDVVLIWNKCSDAIIARIEDSKRSTRQFPWERRGLGSRSSFVARTFVADSAQEASPKHHPGKNLVYKNPSKDGKWEED
jgi:hypothetical protein